MHGYLRILCTVHLLSPTSVAFATKLQRFYLVFNLMVRLLFVFERLCIKSPFFDKIRTDVLSSQYGYGSHRMFLQVVKGQKKKNKMTDQICLLSDQNGALVRQMPFQEK